MIIADDNLGTFFSILCDKMPEVFTYNKFHTAHLTYIHFLKEKAGRGVRAMYHDL